MKCHLSVWDVLIELLYNGSKDFKSLADIDSAYQFGILVLGVLTGRRLQNVMKHNVFEYNLKFLHNKGICKKFLKSFTKLANISTRWSNVVIACVSMLYTCLYVQYIRGVVRKIRTLVQKKGGKKQMCA